MYSRSKESVQFEKGVCYSNGCTTIRRVINVFGCILAIANSAFDILYPIKSLYASNILYLITIVALVLRIFANFAVCMYLYTTWVVYYTPALSQIGE